MTTVEPGAARPEAQPVPEPSPRPRRWRRRWPAPRAHWFFRFVVPLLVVAAALAAFMLWRWGTKSVLDSTDGRVLEPVTDPTEPGYEVFLEPTPTMLVAHVDGPDLVGVTVLARTDLDAGGEAVLVHADMLVPVSDDDGTRGVLLTQAWAGEGMDGVVRLAEELFGVGFTETLVLGTEDLATQLRLVDPVPFFLADDLIQADGSVYAPAGPSELSAEVAADIYGWINPGEPDANRVERQLDLWDSWLTEIGRAEDPLSVTLPFESGLPPYLRALGAGTDLVRAAPLAPVRFEPDARPIYTLGPDNEGWFEAVALEMVPLPVSPRSVSRPSVRLLDGTGDAANREAVQEELVAAGAVVSVIGNAEEFGVADTRVVYHRPDDAGRAGELAAAIDGTVVADENPDAPADMTVTVGLDQVGP